MNATYLNKTTKSKANQLEMYKLSAYHAAGYVASICINNLNKGLPMAHFRIVKSATGKGSPKVYFLNSAQAQQLVKVEGGRLIHSLETINDEETKAYTAEQKQHFDLAFEADIANLLAGPLSEAKYVAQRDDEAITARLVNMKALSFYNGTQEVELVEKYFGCINLPTAEKEKKIVDIYYDTFSFISDASNWRAISKLAEHLLNNGKTLIEADEAARLIAQNIAIAQH